jgi:ribosomal protein S11
VYLTGLTGKSNHWATTGASEVYNPTPGSFTTYIWKNGVSVAYANARQWDVNWLAHDSLYSSHAGNGCSGTARSWVKYSTSGIYTDVNTAQCGFTTTPVYVASLAGKSHHWKTSGGSEIYKATPTGFRIYIHYNPSRRRLSMSAVKRDDWHVTWGAAPRSV